MSNICRFSLGVVLLLASSQVSGHSISFQVKSPDFDGSGLVDFNDFLTFAAAFGTSSSAEDLDSSGVVDFNDFLVFAAAFGTDGTSTDSSGDTEVVVAAVSGQTTDADAMAAAFAPYDRVSTRSDASYLYVDSYGIPDHQMMVNITAWIAQVPIPQPYIDSNAWQIPRNPVYTDSNVSIEDELQRGAIALASNGIPIFNPVNASGLVSADIGELDDFGGHSGRGDDYHYHVAPLHLESTSGNKPIAFALDGFPVYGSKEPDGTTMEALDAHHGHEWSDGSYHYHGTTTYPFLVASMRGAVTTEGDSPQSQIAPQPRAEPPRQGDPRGIPNLNDSSFIITGLTMNATGNGYTIAYSVSGGTGSIEYSWDTSGNYTFNFTDFDGGSDTEMWSGTALGDGVLPGTVTGGDTGGGDSGGDSTGGGETTGDFTVTSDAIADGALLSAFKCEMKSMPDGFEDSIPLGWSGVPDGTGSVAVIMHHYPNPNDTDPSKANQYLLLWDIDPSVTEMAHGTADDGPWYMGANKDNAVISYTSPCSPDASAGGKSYTITVYALSETPASLPTMSSLDVTFSVLLSAIETVTVIDTASITFVD
jgi:phosphatidylethanolamine-binding protein (PEBP) family uncharacterized protein